MPPTTLNSEEPEEPSRATYPADATMHRGTLHIKPYRIFTVVCFAMSVTTANHHHSNIFKIYILTNKYIPKIATPTAYFKIFDTYTTSKNNCGGFSIPKSPAFNILKFIYLYLLKLQISSYPRSAIFSFDAQCLQESKIQPQESRPE